MRGAGGADKTYQYPFEVCNTIHFVKWWDCNFMLDKKLSAERDGGDDLGYNLLCWSWVGVLMLWPCMRKSVKSCLKAKVYTGKDKQ